MALFYYARKEREMIDINVPRNNRIAYKLSTMESVGSGNGKEETTNAVVLTQDEMDTFADFIRMVIFEETKYYCTDAMEDMDEFERHHEVYEKIEKWWKLYDEVKAGRSVFDDYEENRILKIDLDFDILNVIKDEDHWIDNPWFVHSLMNIWNKFSEYFDRADNKDKE